MQWTDGYYTGTEYTSGYYPNLGPEHLRFVCQAAGVRCRIPDQPTYLELGFGRGVSVNIHAAANTGVFWGVDFNPAHVAHAERLAEASGADVVLSEEGFADFCARPDLPMFDVIALHGVWSWISEANRQAILGLIRLRLRPGGVAYVSYNAQPGWSALAPVRHLLELGRDRAGGAAAGVDDPGGVERALDFLQDVVGAGPKYFAEVRPAANLVSGLPSKSRTYLAHEYLNADWHIPYFAEVAARMAEAKLSFVASARVLDRVNDLNLTPEAVALLDRCKPLELRESVRDFMVNQSFRPDIWVKGLVRMTILEQERFWAEQRFVLASVRDEIVLAAGGALGEAVLPAEVYGPIIDALAAEDYRPKTLPEVVAATGLTTLRTMDAVSALTVLVGMDVLRPARVPSDEDVARSRAYNTHVLERAVIGPALKHLAAPVTGGGLACPRPSQIFLRAWLAGDREASALAASTWAVFQTTGDRAVKNQREMVTPEENLEVLTEMAERFIRLVLPLYQALGVLD